MNTKTYFIVREKPTSIGYDFECRYEKPGVDVFSNLGGGKQRREKHGARLWCRSMRFRLSGSGHIQHGYGQDILRKATSEDAAKLTDLQERIRTLQDEFRATLFAAHERGEKVHASDAVNYPKPETDETAQVHEENREALAGFFSKL